MIERVHDMKWLVAIGAVLVLCGSAVTPPTASATPEGRGWRVFGYFAPTNLPPGGTGTLKLYVYSAGALGNSSPVKIVDRLPAGLTAAASFAGEPCEGEGTAVVTCEVAEVPAEGAPGRPAEVAIPVVVGGDATNSSMPVDRVEVEGGGAEHVSSTTVPVSFGSSSAGLGIANLDAWFTNADGTDDLQAGSHPYRATVAFALNTVLNKGGEEMSAGGDPRGIAIKLPPGLVGNPDAAGRCTLEEFEEGEFAEAGQGCPASSEVGEDTAHINFGAGLLTVPIYNLVPPRGVAAQFAFVVENVRTYLDARVRSGGDYGITVHTDNVTQSDVLGDSATFWSVPPGGGTSAPFLTLPTSCGTQLTFGAAILSTWEDEHASAESSFPIANAEGEPATIGECNRLVHFEPSVEIAPDTSRGDTPAGLTTDVRLPQEVNPEGLATSGLKDTTVVLPEGMAINPGQATGLTACQTGNAPGEDGLPLEGEDGEAEAFDGPPQCPASSKVGTDEITTPLLPNKLEGNIYVLQSNPPDLKVLLSASGEGVNVKLVGTVQLNRETGRLTATFEDTPDFPVTQIQVAFSGGAQAALVTPPTCAVYHTSSLLTPWSGLESALVEGSFAVESGPNGAPCQNPLPFNPTMTAGSTTDQAGGYTDFSMLLQRGDGQQRISKLQFKAPDGLSGMISKIPLCKEPGAGKGECPAASQIGHTIVGAGPGPYPLYIPEAGQPPAPIYLTESYGGAPFGLSIVVPLIAGPFNLGTEVVRAQIAVDPHTAQITVTTNPLPTIIDGVPTDLRSIDAVIDRSGFMFNPTNCDPMSFAGTATSVEGTSATLESHFQVGSCQALKFEPNFKVSTSAKTSRADGASLTAKIVYPTGELGDNQATSQSNIEKVKVELPKRLPSRLTTLQKACPAAVFEANPARCPAGSIVGHATAVTPVLPVALTGPAYFVSHGGEAFPSLIVVLQGYGVTVDLVGTTFISKKGITSSTFKQVPDVPVTSFELVLPEGPYSALAANGSLCKGTLKVPTEFDGQNGAVIDQSTKIAVTGCPKLKKAKQANLKKRGRTMRGSARRQS